MDDLKKSTDKMKQNNLKYHQTSLSKAQPIVLFLRYLVDCVFKIKSANPNR
jgi:hypothetical protein